MKLTIETEQRDGTRILNVKAEDLGAPPELAAAFAVTLQQYEAITGFSARRILEQAQRFLDEDLLEEE